MKRKALALVLTAAMAATALAGCGSSADTGSAATTPAASEDTAKDDTAAADTEEDGDYYVDEDGNKYKKFDDVQLKMLVCWNGGFNTADDQYNNEVAAAIRDKIGVTVEFEGIMMSEDEKLNMMFASGDMPEIMMGNPGLYTDLIDGGYVMDLTGNAVIEGLGLTQADMGDVSYQGKWYAFPVDFKTWGVYYNKTIFDELNLKVPTTQTELLEVCKALKAGGYDPWAQWYADGASVDIEMRPVVWTEAIQNGDNDMFEKLMSGEKKVADYPYFAKGLEAWGARMGNWARNDATSNKQSDANEIFLSGQAGMLYQGTWNYGSIEDLKSDDFDYGFFFVPTDDSGKEPVMNVQVDQAFMVNPKAEHAAWAVKFMEFFLSEQMGTWSDATKQPCITGATTENTTDFLKTILDVKASGNTVGYGEFTVPFTSAYTAAYRKALTAYATYCCTGKPTDGVNSVESCIEYMQELFDEEFAQAGL